LTVQCVVGLQWGDEGKGKIVDALCEDFDVVVRFAGGANAGHTVVAGGEKFVLHLIPSGILRDGIECVIGNGVVFDPEVFFEEVDSLHSRGVGTEGRLFVSDRAHVVFPYHKALDGLKEKDRGSGKIGTTARGIGPCYCDKASRTGIRICDIIEPALLKQLLELNAAAKEPLFAQHGEPGIDADALYDSYLEYGRRLAPYIRQTRPIIAGAISGGKNVLFEGAQGALLDIDHGTYPYVTSSSTGLDGVNSGSGIPVRGIDRVSGIVKSYCTRVGDGPFPTEESGDAGKHLQDKGGEVGATTGRPRRCGWLDLVAARYTAAINGVDGVIMTKLDVLTGLKEIRVATAYKHGKNTIDEFPASLDILHDSVPEYETFTGWDEEITGAKSIGELPAAAANYVESVEKMLGLPIEVVSVGVSREQTIFRGE